MAVIFVALRRARCPPQCRACPTGSRTRSRTRCWPSSPCRALAGGLRPPLRGGAPCAAALASALRGRPTSPPVASCPAAHADAADVREGRGRRGCWARARTGASSRRGGAPRERGARDERQLRIAVVPGDGIGVDVIAEAVRGAGGGRRRVRRGDRASPRFDWGADRYLKTGVTPARRTRCAMLQETSTRSCSAPWAIRACPTTATPPTSCSACASARPLRELPARAPLPREALPAEGRAPGGRGLRGVPREHRGPLRDDGRQLQEGHRRTRSPPRSTSTRARASSASSATPSSSRGPRGRRRSCMADKSNVLIHAHDLWQRVFKAVAAEYPGIEASHLYVDNLALQMVPQPGAVPGDRDLEHVRRHRHRPRRPALQGGLGMAASGNIHPGPPEPLRARARLVAAARGQERRQPDGRDPHRRRSCSSTSAGREEARRIEDAVRWAVGERARPRRDIGGALGTREVGEAIVAHSRVSASLTAALMMRSSQMTARADRLPHARQARPLPDQGPRAHPPAARAASSTCAWRTCASRTCWTTSTPTP